ncbi:MAG: response regulator transcription factor [Alphaproteobacteria bacterium]|nr:response regulator transcription factor [Alphaproteobacteria bacterium]MBU0795833.1 response regulator transcription factor [Alphaproteobacteria bacterium]MBU0885759.1 response regulator transcription factor [Alphaproteobacteria bacterium]MBU1814462.1 response regulator transcription factor [Alphaproteobacteria bacterium]
MPRIIVVEDEPSLRTDLVDYLRSCGYDADGTGLARGLAPLLAERPTDIVILDITLPDGNGIDLAREIRANSACGIIILTAHSGAESRISGLESGADAYLVKHASLREIEATVNSLLRRLKLADDQPGDTAGQWQHDATNWLLIAPNGQHVKLTATEDAFMEALVANAGVACSRDALALALSRPSLITNERNLDAIVRRLRRKIEQTSGLPAPIKMSYGKGYIFTGKGTD